MDKKRLDRFLRNKIKVYDVNDERVIDKKHFETLVTNDYIDTIHEVIENIVDRYPNRYISKDAFNKLGVSEIYDPESYERLTDVDYFVDKNGGYTLKNFLYLRTLSFLSFIDPSVTRDTLEHEKTSSIGCYSYAESGNYNFNINIAESMLYNAVAIRHIKNKDIDLNRFLKVKSDEHDNNEFVRVINGSISDNNMESELRYFYSAMRFFSINLFSNRIDDSDKVKIQKDYKNERKHSFAHEFLHALKLDKVYTLNKQNNYYFANNSGFTDLKTKENFKANIDDGKKFINKNALLFDEVINDLHSLKYTGLEDECRKEVVYYTDKDYYYKQNKLETHSGYSDCLDLAEMVEILYGEETLFLSSILYRQQLLESLDKRYEKFFKNNALLRKQFKEQAFVNIDNLSLFEIIGTSFRLINEAKSNKNIVLPLKMSMQNSLLKAIDYKLTYKEDREYLLGIYSKLKNSLLK
ncbi:MAG: hypothetical protein ACOCP8_09925, partial [archaeon]